MLQPVAKYLLWAAVNNTGPYSSTTSISKQLILTNQRYFSATQNTMKVSFGKLAIIIKKLSAIEVEALTETQKLDTFIKQNIYGKMNEEAQEVFNRCTNKVIQPHHY